MGLDTLSTYGLLKGTTAGELGHYFAALEAEGYLFTELEHSTLRLTPKAGRSSSGGASDHDPAGGAPGAIPAPAAAQPVEDSLMAALKATRWKLAQEEGVPLYVIFSNATLADMARRRPRTIEEFLEVSGVGQVKAEKYGRAFLQTLANYHAEEEA